MWTSALSRRAAGRASLSYKGLKIAQKGVTLSDAERKDEAIIRVSADEHVHECVLHHALELKEPCAAMIVGDGDQAHPRADLNLLPNVDQQDVAIEIQRGAGKHTATIIHHEFHDSHGSRCGVIAGFRHQTPLAFRSIDRRSCEPVKKIAATRLKLASHRASIRPVETSDVRRAKRRASLWRREGVSVHHPTHIAAAVAIAMIAACAGGEPSGATDIPSSRFGTVGDDPALNSGSRAGEPTAIPRAVFGDPNRDPDIIRHAVIDVPLPEDSAGPEALCQPGLFTPCVCDNGQTGLRPCEDDQSTCTCDGCPGQGPPETSGMWVTSIGQFIFDSADIALTHRSGSMTGGAGCVIRASVTLYTGQGEGPSCRVTVHAEGALIDEALPLTVMIFEADAGCLGLSPQDQGVYTASEFNEGRLLLSPNSVPSGAAAECWSGSLSITIEALATRTDGQQITISTSEIAVTGQGLSIGEDRVCPQPAEVVDINACPKVVPPTAACNPYCQLGCAAGEHCVVNGSEFGCLPSGALGFGDDCTTADSCGSPLSCFGLSSDGSAQCHRPCITDDDCPSPTLCDTVASIGGGLSLSICGSPSEGCDILGANTCSDGMSCYLNANKGQCLPNGTLGVGEVCEGQAINSCAPGLHCLVTCRELCSTGSEQPGCTTCPGGHHEFSPSLSLGFCVESAPPALCDLFTQADCDDGKGCYPVVGGIACRSAGSLAPGMACQSGNSCTPGYVCVNATCRQLCDLNAPASTPSSCEARCPTSMGAILPVSWQIGVCLDP